MWSIFRQVRLTNRFYVIVSALILLFVLGFLFPDLYNLALFALIAIIFVQCADILLLFRNSAPISASRWAKYQKLSNGDLNDIYIQVSNNYAFGITLKIIDELPVQFQTRNFIINSSISSAETKTFHYQIRPLERGEYHFGKINLFVTSVICLMERHIRIEEPFMMPCYPSFIRLRQFELLAVSNRLSELGVKKIRRIGHSTEFEQIKEYVQGDDVRTINWKATARRSQLMVNHYRDERAQKVYCFVDMGRIMKMPFDGLTLLDYAINASLVISHVAWIKQDKPGLLGFSDKLSALVNPDRKGDQLTRIQEALYNAKTNFGESSYENVLSFCRTKITQRSLILLFTNFESLNGMKRQMKYIRKIASQHLVVVIFFENTELHQLLNNKATDTFKIYEQTIAQKFDFEKRQITKELQQYGILSVYTSPADLTINSLNKYLEIKTRGLI